jgi:hypothetical protein
MSSFARRVRRHERRHALALMRAHGCTCTPTITPHPIGGGIRVGHQRACPRLRELRAWAGVERLPFDVVTARLWPGEERQ